MIPDERCPAGMKAWELQFDLPDGYRGCLRFALGHGAIAPKIMSRGHRVTRPVSHVYSKEQENLWVNLYTSRSPWTVRNASRESNSTKARTVS